MIPTENQMNLTGQQAGGDALFNEPMRVETVAETGRGSWTLGLVGTRSERFRRVSLGAAELAGLTVLDGGFRYDGDGLRQALLRPRWGCRRTRSGSPGSSILRNPIRAVGAAERDEGLASGAAVSRPANTVDPFPMPHQLEAVYGQHEVSELTRSSEKLTRLLDRFVEHDQALARRKESIRQDLEKTRRSILDVSTELARIEERLATLPGLEETLERFREAGLEDRLRERSLLVREERVLESLPERLQSLRESLESLRQEIPIDRLFLSEKALEDLPGREILAGADGILARLSRDVEGVAKRFDEALARADEGIAKIRSRWNERKQEVQRAYEKILRELQKSAVDGEEFIRLQKEIEGLRPLRDRRSLLRRLQGEHLERRRTLLAEWEDLKAEEFRLLVRAAKKVDRKLRDRVQVAVTAAGDREPLFQLLRNEVGGRLSEAIDILSNARDLSLPQFVDSCRSGPHAVERMYSIPPAQARRLAEAPPDVLMRIEEVELPSTTAIRLNTAPSGDPPVWQALDDLSTGQKATAVLLLLLLESDAPLIVDQPEDDLDNRFITEGVVPRMREEKRQRQFIFSTHNANIPVLGDAELILGLTAAGGADRGQARIAPEHVGSIDTRSVRELVEELLEGGRDAFETRRLKYGF